MGNDSTQRVYLAARYSRHPEMRAHAEELAGIGYGVTSRWISGDHEMEKLAEGVSEDEAQGIWAGIDWADLQAADIMISFTEEPGKAGGRNRGGRHVEFGAALALGKRCIVIAHREHVFHYLPAVEFYPTFGACLAKLGLERMLPWHQEPRP